MCQIRIRTQPLPIYPDASSKRPDRMAIASPPHSQKKKLDKRMLRSNYRGRHKTQANTRQDKTLKENRQKHQQYNARVCMIRPPDNRIKSKDPVDMDLAQRVISINMSKRIE